MKLFKKAKKGFTLIELVVVIAVIAILSAVSVVAYVGITNNAKKSVAQQEADKMKTMLRAELTRSPFTYADAKGEGEADDVEYVFSLDSNAQDGDFVKYEVTKGTFDRGDFDKAFEKLTIEAQGYTNKADCSYFYSKVSNPTAAESSWTFEKDRDEKKFVLKISNEKLSLTHPNERTADIMKVVEA